MDNPSPINHLIADISAGQSDDQHLALFEQLATTDKTAWQRLALSLRDELELRSQLQLRLDRDHHQANQEIDLARRSLTRKSPLRHRSWAAWSGWSLAAVLLVAVTIMLTMPQAPGYSPVNGASLASYTAEEALNRYVTRGTEEGRVIAELPTVMVEARELENGKLEVLYLRQFLEREQVNEVYTVSSDELGQPHPVKVDFTGWDSIDSSI